MLTVALVAILLPLAISWTLTRQLLNFAPRLGLVDRPGLHKRHTQVTPLGGGLAIYGAVVLTLALVVATAWLAERFPAAAALLPETARTHAPGVLRQSGLLALVLGAVTVQMAVGLVDDWRPRGLSYQFRLLVEVLLVVGLVTQGVSVTLFTAHSWITAPVTVVWIVGLTNALNFMDNMDGLCGGVALLASAFFAAIAWVIGDLFVGGCFLVLMGALAGFLRFNWPPARIFMGDAGSNFIGFWMGALTVVGTFHRPEFSHITVFAPLCVLAVPIYDSISVIALRLAQGRSPFHPDRQHLSHRLVELGFRPRNAVLVVYLLSLTTGLSGAMLYFLDGTWAISAAICVLLQVVCILGVIAMLEMVAYWRANRRANDHGV
jgi:UDP-GlcNAc:undecaprenyl-phosphate GlcNAc-1-phosphate transferase